MHCWVHNIYRSKMHDNNNTKAGEMAVYCFKLLLLYVKWYNITRFLPEEIEKAIRTGYLE